MQSVAGLFPRSMSVEGCEILWDRWQERRGGLDAAIERMRGDGAQGNF